MKYRRMISFGLAVLMAVSMSACGSTGKTDKASSSTGAAVSASKAASGESAEASSVASGSSDALSDISAIAMDPANTKRQMRRLLYRVSQNHPVFGQEREKWKMRFRLLITPSWIAW